MHSPEANIDRLDLTMPSPAENLALDEALLDRAEVSGGKGVLRFWESDRHFVTLGYANKVAEEIDVLECEARNIPVLRRCSGGGTVLQGPGCLNYALVLRIEENAELRSISGTNAFVMERNRASLASLLGKPVTVEGFTDLATGQLKFSGNAQRRRRDWLLFHGTFLLKSADLELIERCLRPPPRQPDYRRQRSHLEFLTRLDESAEEIKDVVKTAWSASTGLRAVPEAETARLVAERYSRDEWNLKW